MAFSRPCSLTCSHSDITSTRSRLVTEGKISTILGVERSKERIKKMFDKIELSVSSYDTAWVAMVPSLDSPLDPCFPECLNWLMDNQNQDGSWGLPHRPYWLVKDAMSCTLACVLALKRWSIGEEQMIKGIRFIESNFTSVTDDKQHAPIGFDIIFPGMLECAKDLNLNLPLKSTDVDVMLQKRHLEITRNYSEERKEYLAYVSEGMGKLQDWEMAMTYQRKNGSLFDSPSTTAAALTHLQNADCHHYLRSLIDKFGNAVPTVYPSDIFVRLCMIDSLESLGMDRLFRKEIKTVLDETNRCWLEGREEIFLDTATCAMAFRMLRCNGYDVSSDPLTHFVEENQFFTSFQGHLNDIRAVLELYKASQINIHPDELVLEKQKSWTSHFLKQELSCDNIGSKCVKRKVEHALKFPYHANFERLAHRSSIENYCADNIRILKTSYRSFNIGNEDFQKLAVHDFNFCQSLHREEHEELERWFVAQRLDKLKFFRKRMPYCHLSAAAVIFTPELADARVSWAKYTMMATVADDFFDIAGSDAELINLIQLVEKWNVDDSINFCSEQVEIIFSALHSTVCEIGDQASRCQGRNVTGHIVEIWLHYLNCQLRVATWSRNKLIPTLDEYMTSAHVTFALGVSLLSAVYLMGPKLPEEVARGHEMDKLFKLSGTCGRLLNDIRCVERDIIEGVLNAVALRMIHSGGVITEEEAKEKMYAEAEIERRELLRMVLQEKGSIVPRACKDLFWKMSRVVQVFYKTDDGFTTDDLTNDINGVLRELDVKFIN